MFQECQSPQLLFKTNSMRDRRKTWALENDVHLLNQLEDFSRRLVDRTCSLLDKIEDFEKDLKTTRIEVKSLSNNFEAVADNQFVENRVYDEDEDVGSSFQKKNEELPSNTDKADILEAALISCANLLESKFEAVNIPISDSEDDTAIDSNSETVFLPKNRYKVRPLPHLIGGEDFYKDDSLGLLNNCDKSEHINHNIMNGEDGILTHSESTSIDEPDESSAGHEYSVNKLFNNEANSFSDSKDNIDSLFNSQENIWKDNNSHRNIDSQPWKETISEKYPESAIEKKLDDNSMPEKTNPDFSESVQPSNRQGTNVMSSMHDELKQLFAGDNSGERKPKLKVFEKSLETDQKPQDSKTITDICADRSNTSQNFYEKKRKPILDLNSPKLHKTVSKHSEISSKLENSDSPTKHQVISNNPANTYSYEQSKLPIEDKTDKQILKDDMLPNVETEILHSYGKERAKFTGKRRLPSRKPKSLEKDDMKDNVNDYKKENPVLSPSTDEEDLFVLPQTVGKESPASSLFSRPSLFSPGSSIEDSKKSFLSEDIQGNQDKKKGEFFDEPLGIYKTQPTELKSDKNKQLFKDWDPFDSDDGELFPSLEKGNHKTKLFSDSTQSSLKSMQDNDDIFFDKSSTSSSNLFGSSSLSFSANRNINKSKRLSPRLFSDESDEDTDNNDFFSKGPSLKNSFLSSSSNQNNISSKVKSSSLYNETEKSSWREVHTNPLSDPDDSLFD